MLILLLNKYIKVYYKKNMEKIMISKYKSIQSLINAACAKFGLDDPKNYRIRDYWKHKPGKYMLPQDGRKN